MSDQNSSKESNEDETIDNKSLTNKSDTKNSSINKMSGDDNSKTKKYNEILAIEMDNKKKGDTVTKVDVNKNFPVYGYYVRKPVWIFYESGDALDYEPSRNSFVLLVFLIDLVMTVITGGFVIMVFTVESLMEFFEENNLILLMPSVAFMFVLNYVIICSACSRKTPCNIICLVLTVIAVSIIVACISVRYETDILMFGFFATAFVVFCCCLLALTKIDFTRWYLYVIVIGFALVGALIVTGMYGLFSGHQMQLPKLILLLALTLVNCIILTIEIQMVLGGRAMELNEDEYVIGAYLIYTSVIDIFLQVIRVLGIVDES